jgi:hypothetical protein
MLIRRMAALANRKTKVRRIDYNFFSIIGCIVKTYALLLS